MVKDIFCSFYTESKIITNYMVSQIKLCNGDIVLEPSAGEGVFIDEMLNKSIKIDALDINPQAISTLKHKYQNLDNITIRETDTLLDKSLDNYCDTQLWLKNTDTLLDNELDMLSSIGGYYDKIIGNPPYGAWQDYSKRQILKKKYSGFYVKETYSLFLLRCLSLLKKDGILSFIIPDTFLYLNLHKQLRKILLTNAKIHEILIFPSKFFPGVNFGYSNLSIITLSRSDLNSSLKNNVKIIKGFKSPDEFLLTKSQLPSHLESYTINQQDIFKNEGHKFLITETKMDFINCPKLGDFADVVTGFYSGANNQYIKVLNHNVKNSKNYDIVDNKKIYESSSLNGVDVSDDAYIPYIKSASENRYLRMTDEWFVKWDKNTILQYNKNPKTRFQNSKYYFKTGIGLPMIKSNTIKAFLMEQRVFDQSIVGIFPKDSKNLYYMLAFTNSDVFNKLIHIINPTANNSANYIKQVPYLIPSQEDFNNITNNVYDIMKLLTDSNIEQANIIHQNNNEIFNKIYNI